MGIAVNFEMPADIFDFGLPLEARKARRIRGKGWSWTPLTISNFLKLRVSQDDPYWVVYSGSEAIFSALSDWESRQTLPFFISPPMTLAASLQTGRDGPMCATIYCALQ